MNSHLHEEVAFIVFLFYFDFSGRAAELANVCIGRRNVSCVMAAVSEGYDDVGFEVT